MAITLTINGARTKVENGKVEAAFQQARAEGIEERGVLVTLTSGAVSRIATALGLGEEVYTGVGNAKRRVYPGALIARAAELLGGADLIGAVWADPATAARLEAEYNERQAECDRESAAREAAEQAEFAADSYRYQHRGYRNSYRATCGHCGGVMESLAGFDCDWTRGSRRGHATLCADCFAALGLVQVQAYRRPGMEDDGALDALARAAEGSQRRAHRPEDF